MANVEVSKTRAEDELENNAVALLVAAVELGGDIQLGCFPPQKKGEVKKKGFGGVKIPCFENR